MKEIESLIDLALTDNKLSDKEKEIIYKKASGLRIKQIDVDKIIEQKINNLELNSKDDTGFSSEEWKENLSGFKKFLLLFNKDIIKPLIVKFKNNPTRGTLVFSISLIVIAYLFSSLILGLIGILVFSFWIFLIQKKK